MEKLVEVRRVRVAVDGIEVEVEGENLSVSDLMAQAVEARRALGPAPAPSSAQAGIGTSGASTESPARISMVSANTIASLSNANTGSDLVMAAMAHLTLVQGKEVAARREILDEMKAAKTFYKETFGSNLSSYLDSLAKAKRLNLVARETYALTNSERQNFERLIATAA